MGAVAWLRQARDILHEELDVDGGLTGLARRVGRHPVHLARSFRREFGQTIGDYLRGQRVQRARHMLAGTSRTIAEIAALTGCADQAHLTRLFRASTGWTPAAFRREYGTTDIEADAPVGAPCDSFLHA
jgi:AraC family transcriptional regulator